MLVTFVHGALAALALIQQIDTTVAVQRGQRLEVDVFGGDIEVKAWGRNAVRVVASPPSRTELQVSASATSVSVRTEGRRGPPANVDVSITVPAWMPLDLNGVNGDMMVKGVHAAISAETVQGEIDVTGGDGLVSLQSVQGGVTLTGANGRLEVHSVNEDVRIRDASGEIQAETVNGSVVVANARANSLEASTVNGDVSYDGPIQSSGRYSLSSHNGDITLTVADGTSATVEVSTFNGDFESDVPVTVRETRKGKRFSFTLGSGSAHVSLESFQGTISLVRPGNSARGR